MATHLDAWRESLRQRTKGKGHINIKSLRQGRTRARSRPRLKPAWDNTVNDLSVFKASPAELIRRHEIHQPKADSERVRKRDIDFDLLDKENEAPSDFDTMLRDVVGERKRAIIKEIFYNQEKELQNVLRETDKTINQVKDMFGDEPKRYRSIPNITSAPQASQTTSNSHVLSVDDGTIVYPKVLNADDNLSLDKDGDQEIHTLTGGSDDKAKFCGELDLDYYKNLLLTEEQKQLKQKEIRDEVQNKMTKISLQRQHKDTSESQRRDVHSFENVDGVSQSADLDFGHTNTRIQPDDHQCDKAQILPSAYATNLNDLQDLLQRLEVEMNHLEEATGNSNCIPKQKMKGNISGFARVILSNQLRLIHYMKATELQRKADAIVINQLREDLEEQKALVDALTAELMDAQEQVVTTAERLVHLKRDVETKITGL